MGVGDEQPPARLVEAQRIGVAAGLELRDQLRLLRVGRVQDVHRAVALAGDVKLGAVRERGQGQREIRPRQL